MSAVLLEPFRGIFPTRVYDSDFVVEFSTLFALLAYGILYLLITALVNTLTPAQEETRPGQK